MLIAKAGPKWNNQKFAFVGIIISDVNNFKPSKIGCNNPQGPLRLGPYRRCKEAITFLSKSV